MAYSFCESVFATSVSRWHIRQLSKSGPKYGGGADTPSLCGLDLCKGWDLYTELTPHHLGHACKDCVNSYLKASEIRT